MQIRPKHLIILVLLPLAISFIVGLLFWNWYVLDERIVDIDVSVTNESLLGFNTGTDKLYFGTLARTGSSERKATAITAFDARVAIEVRGKVAQWISVSQNNFLVEPNVPQDIIFRINIPEDAMPGNYTGKATIRYYRIMPWE